MIDLGNPLHLAFVLVSLAVCGVYLYWSAWGAFDLFRDWFRENPWR